MDTKPTQDEATDIVHWIDTDAMLADALTQIMNPEKLVEALQSNYWDVKQPIASLAKKRVKQAQRRKAANDDPQCGHVETPT